MTTAATVINKALRQLLSGTVEARNKLASTVNSSATSIVCTYALEGLRAGQIFEIESEVSANVERADVVHVARFFYPNTNYDKVLDLNYTAPKNQLQAIVKDKATHGSTNSINILYSFVGEANISTPIEIFDDKKKTYIRFKSGIDYDKLKINFSKSKTNLIDIRFKKTGDFIVLDGVYSRLTIKYSDKTTQVFNDILDSK